MNKFLLFLFFSCFAIFAAADNIDFSEYFKGKSGCFVLFDAKANQLTTQYNYLRCEEQIPPDSTFKIPLSLMAFDQKLITNKTVFQWDKKDRAIPAWNQDQTPQSWLSNSTVWVSQELTAKLGAEKIKDYLHEFNYGNQDFSGNPGMNDGLMNAWRDSSLKISADEQVDFLKLLVTDKLPVSVAAMKNTKANMYLETSPKGWKLYGKTGSGIHGLASDSQQPQDGWFVGYVEKAGKTYVFVLNFTDLEKPDSTESGGVRAKQLAMTLLGKLGVF